LLSHRKAIESAKDLECVLILEDDVVFADDFDNKLKQLLKYVPDFDMLFLNGTLGNFQKAAKENDFIYRVYEMYGAFAYLIKRKFYSTVISELEINKGVKSTDEVYSGLMMSNKIYRAVQPLVFHKRGWSDRTEVIEKGYKHLEK